MGGIIARRSSGFCRALGRESGSRSNRFATSKNRGRLGLHLEPTPGYPVDAWRMSEDVRLRKIVILTRDVSRECLASAFPRRGQKLPWLLSRHPHIGQARAGRVRRDEESCFLVYPDGCCSQLCGVVEVIAVSPGYRTGVCAVQDLMKMYL